MKKIRALIVDDEKASREVLSILIQKFCPDIQVIETAEDTFEAELLIREHRPELVFLDIEIPNRSGIEFLKTLDAIDFYVIFTTGFDKYALDAIKLSALDYLVKPIDIEELIRAVHKLKTEKNYLNKLEHFMRDHGMAKKVALNQSSRIDFVEFDRIVYCNAEGSYTNFTLLDGRKILVSKLLKEFESSLPENLFYRCHKSYIVNLRYITYYDKENYLHMSNGDKIIVARSKKDEIVQLITN